MTLVVILQRVVHQTISWLEASCRQHNMLIHADFVTSKPHSVDEQSRHLSYCACNLAFYFFVPT